MLRALVLSLALIALPSLVDAKPDEEKKPKKGDVVDLSAPSTPFLLLGGAAALVAVAAAAALRRRNGGAERRDGTQRPASSL